MGSMRAWLENYESRRTGDPYSTKKLSSSKFDLESMSWDEIRDIPIEEIGPDMTFGKCFESLRKTWYSYKRNKKEGLPAPDLAFRILKLQKALGLPLSEFDELDSEWVNDELTSDDLELRREEYEDAHEPADNEDDEQITAEERQSSEKKSMKMS